MNIRKANALTLRAYFPNSTVDDQNIRGYLSRVMDGLEKGVTEQRKSTWKIMLSLDPIIKACHACRVEQIKMTRKTLEIEVSSSKDINDLVKKIQVLPNIALETKTLKAKQERNKLRLILTFQENQS